VSPFKKLTSRKRSEPKASPENNSRKPPSTRADKKPPNTRYENSGALIGIPQGDSTRLGSAVRQGPSDDVPPFFPKALNPERLVFKAVRLTSRQFYFHALLFHQRSSFRISGSRLLAPYELGRYTSRPLSPTNIRLQQSGLRVRIRSGAYSCLLPPDSRLPASARPPIFLFWSFSAFEKASRSSLTKFSS